MYNSVPNQRPGINPITILTKTKSNHRYLRPARVWGCPFFVVEAKFQDNQKLPKWYLRSRLGQFIGFSDKHYILVLNVCNLQTGYISPKYYFVFDDLFETKVRTGDNDPVIDNICNELSDSSRDWYAKEEFDPDGQ